MPLQPVLPLYVGELQGSMDRIVLVSGILFSIVGVSGVIASPLWGVAGQKWGYRPVLYLALAGSAVFGAGSAEGYARVIREMREAVAALPDSDEGARE